MMGFSTIPHFIKYAGYQRVIEFDEKYRFFRSLKFPEEVQAFKTRFHQAGTYHTDGGIRASLKAIRAKLKAKPKIIGRVDYVRLHGTSTVSFGSSASPG